MEGKTKKKARCECCLIIYRTKCLSIHKPTGQRRCKRCINKYGTNKFYSSTPRKDKNQYMFSKYTMSEQEKQILRKKLREKGYSERAIEAKINKDLEMLNKTRRNRCYEEPKGQIEMNKKKEDPIKEKMVEELKLK